MMSVTCWVRSPNTHLRPPNLSTFHKEHGYPADPVSRKRVQKAEGSSPPRRTVKRPVSIETGLFLPPKYLNQRNRAREVSKPEGRSAWIQPLAHIAKGRCRLKLAILG